MFNSIAFCHWENCWKSTSGQIQKIRLKLNFGNVQEVSRLEFLKARNDSLYQAPFLLVHMKSPNNFPRKICTTCFWTIFFGQKLPQTNTRSLTVPPNVSHQPLGG